MEKDSNKINLEELEEVYNDFVITNGTEYWVYLLIETIINNSERFENKSFSMEEINNMAESIMNNDYLWQTIEVELWNELNNF